ncbi:MAG: penicillin-binding protein 1A [Chromatiales bacterium]
MLRWTFNFLFATFLLAVIAGIGLVWYLIPGLPAVETLRDVRLQVPLRVYTQDGALIGEFGEKRRIPLRLGEVPDIVIKAFLDAEDDRFYDHPGVDWQGLIRATVAELRTGNRRQGGSTITQQVARAYFLTPEKTYIRKLREILLALKIEKELSKEEILELYLNTIFLGQRAYGIGAAAQVYYGASLEQLTLDQVATISGIPPAPTRYNPVYSPRAAHERRGYVLRRLLEKGHITQDQYLQAMGRPVDARVHTPRPEVEAPDVAEMTRQYMIAKYGEEAATTSGYRVYTTVDGALQAAANAALRAGVMEYDRRHGYRGPERHVDLSAGASETQWRLALAGTLPVGGLSAAIVTGLGTRSVKAYSSEHGALEIEWEGLSWAAPYIDRDRRGPAPKKAADIVKVGDIVRVHLARAEDAAKPKPRKGADDAAANAAPPLMLWRLAQVPAIQGALVSLSPENGAVKALVGGFDFKQSKFNRVTQAFRQPGSSFKPFLYSAALESGFTPASLINDAPIVFDAPGLDATWRPENYSGEYIGPTRLREALSASRNLVSIRLLRAIGIDYAAEYAKRFGFVEERLPRDLSLALGTGVATPLEMAGGYAVFANGGFRIEPYLTERVETDDHQVLFHADPVHVCRECEAAATARSTATFPAVALSRQAPRVISAENAWMMISMMQDVIKFGTARRAQVLKRSDLAGKTGTTNEQRDAWFSGYNTKLETTVWVGFDQSLPLGKEETGARAALPIWIDFMRRALESTPDEVLPQPQGLVTVRIDPATGALAGASSDGAIFETFRSDQVPTRSADEVGLGGAGDGASPQQLF